MFDVSWIADLDAASACEAVVVTQDELRERELAELVLAAHWAALHGPETVPARRGRVLPGPERAKQAGGPGTPHVSEFACAEFGVLMGTGFIAADHLIRDAVDLQHRHPRMWAALAAGCGRVWKARKVARLVHTADLSLEQANLVDARTTPYVDSLPWGSFQRLVLAEIIAVDPAAADQRRLARELEQFVSTTQSDEKGLKTLVARAEAGEIIVFVAVCDRIAQILALQGDQSPVGARRARAVGILANPARAVALLREHASREPEWTADGEPFDEADRPHHEAHPIALDPDKLRPKAVLHVRVSEEALRSGVGVAVCENDGVGPITVAEAIDLLGHCQVSVRPVLDLRDQLPVDAYEIPAAMRDSLALHRPSSVFPWTGTGLGAGRRTDIDHTVPYLAMSLGGSPGQTRIDNLGPLHRFAHRVKTHGRGWAHHQPVPGVYLWRTPHGYWYRVDRHGTHPLGRDPDPRSSLEAAFARLIAA